MSKPGQQAVQGRGSWVRGGCVAANTTVLRSGYCLRERNLRTVAPSGVKARPSAVGVQILSNAASSRCRPSSILVEASPPPLSLPLWLRRRSCHHDRPELAEMLLPMLETDMWRCGDAPCPASLSPLPRREKEPSSNLGAGLSRCDFRRGVLCRLCHVVHSVFSTVQRERRSAHTTCGTLTFAVTQHQHRHQLCRRRRRCLRFPVQWTALVPSVHSHWRCQQ